MKHLIILILLISCVGCNNYIRRDEFNTLRMEVLQYKDRFEFQEQYNQAQDETIKNLKKEMDNIQEKQNNIIILPNYPYKFPDLKEEYNPITYTCYICKKTFKRTNLNISCAVYHPRGTCCHYGEEEIKE